MANNVRGKVWEAFAAKLVDDALVTKKMVSDLRALFEQGEKVSADDVTAILTESAQDVEDSGA